MSYRNLRLGAAINHHFNGAPPAHITTKDGVLTNWPTEPWPTDADLEQWCEEYEQALPPVPRSDMERLVDRIKTDPTALAALKAALR